MGIGENVGENVAENTGVAGSTSFLAPPTGFTIDSVTTTTMSVSWTAPSKGGATSYKVVNTSTSAVVATTAWGDTDAIIYGLDSGTSYTFHVVTSDGVAQSVASNTDTDTTEAVIPSTDSILLQNDSSTWVYPFVVDLGNEGTAGTAVSWTMRDAVNTEALTGGWNGEDFARMWVKNTQGNHGIGLGLAGGFNPGSVNPGVNVVSQRILVRPGPKFVENRGEFKMMSHLTSPAHSNQWAMLASNVLVAGDCRNNPNGYRRQTYYPGDYGASCNAFLEECRPAGHNCWPPASPNVLDDHQVCVFTQVEEQRTPGVSPPDGGFVDEWVCIECIVSLDPAGNGSEAARAQVWCWSQDGAIGGLWMDGHSESSWTNGFTTEGYYFYHDASGISDRATTAQAYVDVCAIRIAAGEFDNPQGPPDGFIL